MQADHGVFHGDAYAVLGVKRTADVAEIKQAWKRKMLECHPDGDAARGRSKAGAAARNEQAKLINGAWNTLKKPERRIQYDECYPTAGTDGETPRRPTWSRPEPTSDADAQTHSRPTASSEPTDDAGGYRRRRRGRTGRSGRGSDRPPGYTGQRNPDEPYHDPDAWGRYDPREGPRARRAGATDPGGRRRQPVVGRLFHIMMLLFWTSLWGGCGAVGIGFMGAFIANGPAGPIKVILDLLMKLTP